MGFPERVEVYDGGRLEGPAGLRRAIKAYYGRRVRLEAWDGFELVDRAEGQAWNHGASVRVGNLDVNSAPQGLHCDLALTDLNQGCATFVGPPSSPEACDFFFLLVTLFEMGMLGEPHEPYQFTLRTLEDDLRYHWGVGELEHLGGRLLLKHERGHKIALVDEAHLLTRDWPLALADSAVVSLVPKSWYSAYHLEVGGEIQP